MYKILKRDRLDVESENLKGDRRFRPRPPLIDSKQLELGDALESNFLAIAEACAEEEAKDKVNAMRNDWIPGVNNLGFYGRWAFAEFTVVFEIQSNFDQLITQCRRSD